MSNDCILIGWHEIYEKLFCSENGTKSMSMQTLRNKHGPGLKACGALFSYNRGHARTPAIAGWQSVIQNYFIKLGAEEDAKRVAAKANKRNNAVNNAK